MKIVKAEFLTGAVSPKQYPKQPLPEVAFIGRSNVGKSSLINSLVNRKKLVKTSATPGKTQMINFFNINDAWMLADLPGYGFARVPDSVKKHWQTLIENYLQERDTLESVVLIVDIRRKPTELDLHMKDWLQQVGLEYVVVATKADKLSQTERQQQMKKIKQAFSDDGQRTVLMYSSKNNNGRKELWSYFQNLQKKEEAEPETD
ncbi:ribosome biogenesis GTP-binding protein YihA/YsxC [Nitrospina watsonii]|uniref:Probable GTP-binding protein EngB n=1 Tax=Nitrospina watsonii TaxID=1323948 RepID=A0ABM9HG63_9BACT|nr:ribosome biogenesis GTP-binding protein YihA/YsxC [Nitrospina watsonii]CAI2719311.1 putative GTP-binding protein EngB [Nitrospina watsonii]